MKDTLNSFRQLPRALAEAAAATQDKPSDFIVYEEDDLISCIWRVLSDKRPRTANEIAHILRDTEWKVAAVSMALRRLANEGSFEVSMSGNQKFNAYNIKKGMEMAVELTNATPRKFETKEAHVHDSRGVIKMEEGIDVCIWKATCDRKARLIDEIGEILFQYGFNRVGVKDRVVYLANAKKWFDRQGKSKSTRYSLKRGIAMPTPIAQAVTELADKGSSANTFRERDETFTPPAPVQPEVKAAVAVATPIPLHTIVKEEGFHVSIWKAMCDYREYTAPEVGLLLEAVGFNPKSVGTQLGELWKKKGWFIRRPVEGSKTYAYTLKREIKMPEPAVIAPKPDAPVETQPQLQLEAKPDEPKAKEEIMAAQPVAAQAPALFEFNLRLKGIDFDINEAKELTQYLNQNDYSAPPEDEVSTLIETSVKIKGMEFSRHELMLIKSKLNKAGFGGPNR